jgi:four helix bundle protein
MMQITELEVWKAAIELAKKSYEMTAEFSDKEHYGLAAQIRRTVTNIPANISAAASRKHGKESLRHLFRARDLIYEVESHIYLANSLEYISEEYLEQMLETLNTSKRLLFGFIKYYKRSGSSDYRPRRSYERNNPEPMDDVVHDSDLDEIDDDF